MPASYNYLSSYLEDAFAEILSCLDPEDQADWFGLYFDASGNELWEGIDNLKDQTDTVLELLDIEPAFKKAVFHSIDFHDLMDRVKWMALAFRLKGPINLH